MKILIYSDVHGNLPAFERVIEAEGVCDSYICLGDLVNYGPWSNECVSLALSLPNSIILKGNHEEAFIQGFYTGANPLVKQFFDITFEQFNKTSDIITFLEDFQLGNFNCIHTLDNKNIYPDTNIRLTDNFIIGHSHHQFLYENNGYTLYNCGSLGQNRKYINVANYLIYNTVSESIEMKYITFDLKYMISEMKIRKYPVNCIDYYLNKQIYNG